MIGKKIKKIRSENNISQIELASKIFVSRQTISRWERGETMPNTENIVQLSNFFEVETTYFLEAFSNTENEPIKEMYVFDQIKKILRTYKLDIYIFSFLHFFIFIFI